MPSTHTTSSKSFRTQAVELLNKPMAAAIDLRDPLKQAHGNVRGPTFIAVHQLCDRVAGEAESYSDLFTEISRRIGLQLRLVESQAAPE